MLICQNAEGVRSQGKVGNPCTKRHFIEKRGMAHVLRTVRWLSFAATLFLHRKLSRHTFLLYGVGATKLSSVALHIKVPGFALISVS